MPDLDDQRPVGKPASLAGRRSSPTDPYRTLFERSADAILIIEGETFVDCNQATVEMLRYQSKEELLRTHPSELSPPTQPDGRSSYEKANEMIAKAFAEGSHRFEWDHKRADGEVFPVEVLLTAVPEGDRSILHVVWRDITTRKELEHRLRHTQKMEAIGMLAGGIAHDFNNLLVAIMGNAELLDLESDDLAEQRGLVAEILQASRSAADLTRQLLAFSRRQILQPRVVDLNRTLSNLEKLLGRLVGEDMIIATRQCEGELRVKIDPGQIEQVVVNLINNARDAMPDGGTVTVATRRVTLEEGSVELPLGLAPGDYAELSISDTGHGMSEDVVKRAFDPFFTTKAIGEGTGLGLSTVYGIVKQSHGDVTLHSDLEEGTTITIYLPSTREDLYFERTDPASATLSRGVGETILVVEDEPSVAKLVARVLEDRGYEVLLATDGETALECFRRQPETIDLLLTDVVMPAFSGPELVERLRREGLEPRVLFASGYVAGRMSSAGRLPDDALLLNKPFSNAELLSQVRLALDRDRTGSSRSQRTGTEP